MSSRLLVSGPHSHGHRFESSVAIEARTIATPAPFEANSRICSPISGQSFGTERPVVDIVESRILALC
jgi:hypothetical protein